MRLGKLGPALIAATSLLALAPAAASAHKHPSPRGRCAINIRVAERQITAGEQVEVKGRLKCFPRASAGGQAVTLYEYVAGTAGYVPVQSTTTDTSGVYQFKPPALNANTSFYVRSHGAQSGHEKARVAAPGDAHRTARRHPDRNRGAEQADVQRHGQPGRRRRARDPAAPERRHRRRMAPDRHRPGEWPAAPTRSRTSSACPATRAFACSCAATASTARAPRLRWSTRSPRRRTRA